MHVYPTNEQLLGCGVGAHEQKLGGKNGGKYGGATGVAAFELPEPLLTPYPVTVVTVNV
jgi:hypothetical protein